MNYKVNRLTKNPVLKARITPTNLTEFQLSSERFFTSSNGSHSKNPCIKTPLMAKMNNNSQRKTHHKWRFDARVL